MSHEVMYSTYNENVDRKKVKSSWDEYVSKADWQEGASGLFKSIRWLEKLPIADNYETAMELIKSNDTGCYDQLAVRFYEYGDIEPTKTYFILKERCQRLSERYRELRDAIHYKGVKSSFVSCRYCESKLSSKYFDKIGNRCPVCGNDLRPESTLEKISTAKKNAEKALREFKAEEERCQTKQRKNAKVKWLLKIEYHT